ncbi:EndoU domain-containing protein [Goodfellowiella coeruleoviolacea]|uniref:EndoU nuclease n=1 Tax=Goodfellowiella coeruleoviolacea TaxID=334858 RepID=A0AAE3GKG1_9PSEU|nr:EndoU domain-containing protein [Goodfellowiella coeruleoviolacea]MCP2168879.1 EndoU nuclease [Goodfellowiella coeruleoviolacea]
MPGQSSLFQQIADVCACAVDLVGQIEHLLGNVLDLVNEIVLLLTSASQGTRQSDVDTAIARFCHAQERMPALLACCRTGTQYVERWINRALGMTLTGQPVYPLPADVPVPAPFALPKYPLLPRLDRHLFQGHRRGWLLTGLHHVQDGMLPDGIRLERRSVSDSNGVYAAEARRLLPNGRIIEKRFATFFPEHWEREEVAHAIRVAFSCRRRPTPRGEQDSLPRAAWEGYYRDVLIRGYVSPGMDAMTATFADVRTAWPVGGSSEGSGR